MYRMIATGTTRPSSSSGRRRVVCPLMAAAATRETPWPADLRPGETRDLDPGAQAGFLQDVRDVGLRRPW